MPLSAEDRVEHQKLNQTATLLSFGWVFGFQLDSLEKDLITVALITFTLWLLVPLNINCLPPTHPTTKATYFGYEQENDNENDEAFFWILV